MKFLQFSKIEDHYYVPSIVCAPLVIRELGGEKPVVIVPHVVPGYLKVEQTLFSSGCQNILGTNTSFVFFFFFWLTSGLF